MGKVELGEILANSSRSSFETLEAAASHHTRSENGSAPIRTTRLRSDLQPIAQYIYIYIICSRIETNTIGTIYY